MGNWRTVQIVGTCPAQQVKRLREHVAAQYPSEEWGCLSGGQGICGLPVWPEERISAVGNLAERDYSVIDVANCLQQLALTAPGLAVKVHCGGDYQSERCIATVTLTPDKLSIGCAEVEAIPSIPSYQMEGAILRGLLQGQGQGQTQMRGRKKAS